MGIRRVIATVAAAAGSTALAVGAYGMQTLGECSIDAACPVPLGVTIPAFAGGMLVCILATIIGAGALGFGLTFLAPGIASIAAIVTGHGSVVSYVFAVVFTPLGLLALAAGALASRGERHLAVLEATGSRGVGTVLSIKDTGMSVNDNPGVELQLRIQPDDGSPAFGAAVVTMVSRVAIPRPGDRYRVAYDPANQTQIVLGDPVSPAATAPPGTAPSAVPAEPPAWGAPQPPAWGTPQPPGTAGPDTVIDQLTKLDALRRSGALTEAEFQQQKARLLEG